MNTEDLSEILHTRYGIRTSSVRLLREGGGTSYIAEGDRTVFLKAIGPAFAETARQSVSVMRFLEERGFPVPKTLLTRDGDALTEIAADGEKRLFLAQEYVAGDEPDLTARAEEIGAMTGRLHTLLEAWPGDLVTRGKEFFIGRYLDFLRRKRYPRLSDYEALGDYLWSRVEKQPRAVCHGDLHRGNLIETPEGRIFFMDFDTVCRAPAMFDCSVLCDLTDYFRLKQKDAETAKAVYRRFLAGYTGERPLSGEEKGSFFSWVAIRHFQLQATILEIHGIDCVDASFIDRQLDWLAGWRKITAE